MSFEIGEAFIRVETEVDQSGLDSATSEMESNIQSSADRIGGAVTGAGTTLTRGFTAPIVGATVAGFGLVKSAANSADEIAKNARSANISTDAYQELEFALGQAGMGQDTMNRMLDRNNQRLGRAQAGNEKYAGAYEDLGVAITDSNGEMRGSEEVMDDVIRALEEIENPAERAALAGELLGTKTGRELAASLNGGAGAMDETRQEAHDLGLVLDGDAMDAAENFNDSIDVLQRSFMAMVMEIGTALMPAMEALLPVIREHIVPAIMEFAEWVTGLIERFMEADPLIHKIVGGFVAFMAAIGPILIVVGKVITVFGTLWGWFSKIITIAKLLIPVIAGISAPVLIVIGVIAALIAIGVLLWKNWDTVKEWAQKIWSWIRDFFTETIPAIYETIKEWFGRAWDYIKDVWNSVMDFIGDVLGNIRDFFVDAWNAIYDTISEWVGKAWDFIKSTWETVYGWISNLLTDVFNFYADIFQSIYETIRDWIQTAWDWLVSAWTSIYDWISNLLTDVWNFYVDIFTSIYETIKDWVTRAWDWLVDTWTTIYDWISGLLTDTWNFYVDIFTSIYNTIVEWITKAWDWLVDTWNQIFDFYRTILGNIWDAVVQYFTDIYNTVVDWITNAWNFIQDTWNSIKNFLITTMAAILADIIARWTDIYNTVKEWMNKAREAVETVLNAIRDFFNEIWEGIRSFVEGIVNNIRDAITGAFETARDNVGNAFNAMRDRIASAWDSIVSKIKGAVNSVIGFINRLISAWNGMSFSIPKISIPSVTIPGMGTFGGGSLGGQSFGTTNIPTIPLLAKGGDIRRGGMAMVGEKGAEVLSLPKGARVTPLPKGGDTYNVSVSLHAKDLEEFRQVTDFFDEIRMVSRQGVDA